MKSCFVIMGFGTKTDFATGRALDLDATYKNIIKPAVTEAGYECIRADEVRHSGMIDVPMYDRLFTADLVVADLSTSNSNAIFELGVRYALKPRATIIIAEEQYKQPFDITHIVIRTYKHLGPDIGFGEVMRMRDELKALVAALEANPAVDSPVFTVLRDLKPPLREAAAATTATVETVQVGASVAESPEPADQDTYATMLEMAQKAKASGDFEFARKVLRQLYDEQIKPGPDGKLHSAGPRVTRELALVTYKAGEKAAPEVAEKAYEEAAELLRPLGPETTTDPETLGLWSAIHKRRTELPGRSDAEKRADLDIAIRAVERGFLLRQDHYNGTNLAYLLNLRASLSSGDDRIADNVLADRVRRQVVAITAERLDKLEAATAASDAKAGTTSPLEEEKYWVAASHAEALIALGVQSGRDVLQKAIDGAPAGWMADITSRQLEKLNGLLGQIQRDAG